MSSPISGRHENSSIPRPSVDSQLEFAEPLIDRTNKKPPGLKISSLTDSTSGPFTRSDENLAHHPPPRRSSIPEEDEWPGSRDVATATIESKREAPVTWKSLPKKDQLAVLTIARLSEPLAERSFSAYLFYQLRSFDPSLPDKTISSQGGMLTASFAAAQFVTAVWWGRAADSPRIGRKRVILIGLVGTTISCIGVGFSNSFAQALFFRVCAGCLNGNVGVMRTMISEIIQEKK